MGSKDEGGRMKDERGRRPGTTRPRRGRWCCAVRLLTYIVALTALPGCNLIGALAYKTVGPPAVPAQYVPPKEPTLVMVENFRNPAAVRLDAERLSRYVSQELDRRDIVPIVAAAALDALRDRPDFARMTPGQIGQAAGAKQVLYVDLLKFNVEDALGSEMIRGQMELTVRFVDAASGKTLWPTDSPEGMLLSIETPYRRTGPGTGPSGGGPGATEMGLREAMSTGMAAKISRLFRKWKPDEEGDSDEKG